MNLSLEEVLFYEESMTIYGVAESLVNLAKGEIGLDTLMNLAPAAGSLLGRVGRKLGVLDGCFVADTPVARGWRHVEVATARDGAGSTTAIVTPGQSEQNRWQTIWTAGAAVSVLATGYVWHRERRRKKRASEDTYFASHVLEDLLPLRQPVGA